MAETISFDAFSIVFPLVNCSLTAIQYSLTVSNKDGWAGSLSFDAISLHFNLLTAL